VYLQYNLFDNLQLIILKYLHPCVPIPIPVLVAVPKDAVEIPQAVPSHCSVSVNCGVPGPAEYPPAKVASVCVPNPTI
jgi:hypothetical protein